MMSLVLVILGALGLLTAGAVLSFWLGRYDALARACGWPAR
jgi:hypothetical protein